MPIQTIGRCGGSAPHLPPQQGRPDDYHAGPFAARLAPTMVQRMSSEAPSALWLGLLIKSPNLDGREYLELEAPGYDRRRVAFASYNADFDANLEPVVFRLTQGVVANHVGLFDADGCLRFYGFLSGHERCPHPPAVLEFPAFGLMLRRFRPTVTGGPRPQLGGARLS